jgi:hypothetical protein
MPRRVLAVGLAGLAGCVQLARPIEVNGHPTVTVTGLTDASIVAAGEPVTLTAWISDPENEPMTVTWGGGGQVLCPESAPQPAGEVSSCPLVFAEGEAEVVVEVRDANGQMSAALARFAVVRRNLPPTCGIVAPDEGLSVGAGEEITFVGAAEDPDGPATALLAVWSSALDGPLHEGALDADGRSAWSTAGLSPGAHPITLTVTDPDGGACADAVDLTVRAAPTVAFQSPAPGQVFPSGTPVALRVTVADPDSLLVGQTVSFRDASVGLLGAGAVSASGEASATVDLAPGPYAVTAEVSDPEGVTGAATLAFAVNAPAEVPFVAIGPAAPLTADDLVAAVDPVVDPDGPAATLVYRWWVDGAVSAAHTTAAVPAADTSRGEQWQVGVSVDDGVEVGPEAMSAPVVIGNTGPGVPVVAVEPADPIPGGDDLVCRVTGAAADPDSDPLVYTFTWTSDQVGAYAGPTLTTDHPGDTVPAVQVQPFETWTCEARAADGDATGAPAQSAATARDRTITQAYLASPCTLAVRVGAAEVAVRAEVEVPGLTNLFGPDPSLTVAVGIGNEATDPATHPSWQWRTAGYDGDRPLGGVPADDPLPYELDGFYANPAPPTAPGFYDIAGRVSLDGGVTWSYFDLGGDRCGGLGLADGYSSADALLLTVDP